VISHDDDNLIALSHFCMLVIGSAIFVIAIAVND